MSGKAAALLDEQEMTRMEIRNFVNEGLKDVANGDLLDFDEVFDELEERYADE